MYFLSTLRVIDSFNYIYIYCCIFYMYHEIQHFQFKSTQRSQIKTKVDSFIDAASVFWAAFLHHWAAHISHIQVNECIFLLPWHKLNCASANLYVRVCVCVCVCVCMLKNQSGKILKDSQRCVEEFCKHHAKRANGWWGIRCVWSICWSQNE